MSTNPESIHVLLAKVLADLPAIGKDQVNTKQHYRFRGIDDVLSALNPILSRHGVFFVPEVIERIGEERATNSGGVSYVVHLHVRYRFFGPAGDSVTADGWGEATDSGDKATSKAMTSALKYVLFQTFAIATAESGAADADHFSPEATTGTVRRRAAAPPTTTAPAAPPSTAAKALMERVNGLADRHTKTEAMRALRLRFGASFDALSAADIAEAEALVDVFAGAVTASNGNGTAAA